MAKTAGDTDTSGDSPVTKITPSTMVSLGMIISVLGSLLVACLWVNNAINRVEANRIATDTQLRTVLAEVTNELKNLRTDLDNRLADRWRVQDMENWALRFQLLNPTARVPDPHNPSMALPGGKP